MKVEYFQILDDGSDTLITREMEQKDLASLLMQDNVVLYAVNKTGNTYRYRKKKKKDSKERG
jgi:hypothetical protein